MKIHDISKELLTAPAYPGDPAATIAKIASIANGDFYNLSRLSMSSHSGTHVDAPRHFIEGARAIDEMNLSHFIGFCTVCEFDGIFTVDEILPILRTCEKRLLIKGDITITAQIATAIADSGVVLLGVDGLTVGPLDAPMEVHLILLRRGIAILENLDLSKIKPGKYTLCAAPLKIGGGDGAPCRAVLIEEAF